ncbi:MAG: hypothetical protein IKV15_00540 [Bacteroidaceae bacterium]|nr:hypothetical protein [Bacteroidaceae bacterium]
MLKIYLDWNVITHLKEDKYNESRNFILANKEYFIFPYSVAHLQDLLVSRTPNNVYYEQDLNMLTELCQHHFLEHEPNSNSPYPYKCYPKEYLETKDVDVEWFNSGFTKDSFLKCIKSKGGDPIAFMSILEKAQVTPFNIPFIDRVVCNLADIFNVLFDYGHIVFNSVELPKQVKEFVQSTTDSLLYKRIQGSQSHDVFTNLNEATLPQTNKTFTEIIESSVADRSKSNLELFTSLYLALNFSGFYSDKNRNLQNIYTDSEHAYYASACDIFVSNDSRLREKASAIYKTYNIPTKVIDLNELIDIMQEELSRAYDLEYMFNEILPKYGNPCRSEGENDVYKQLPFCFLGLFNFCLKANYPNANNITGIFRIVVPERGYVFYTELERFFNLLLGILPEAHQKQKFQKEFIDKFLTGQKELIKTAVFSFEDSSCQLSVLADEFSQYPLPILYLTVNPSTSCPTN